MFKGNPYKLPEDKFVYVQNCLTDNNICVELVTCDSNPNLDMNQHLEYRAKLVERKDAESRQMPEVSFVHYKLVLRRLGIVRSIYVSVDTGLSVDYFSSFGDDTIQNGLYALVTLLWLLCCSGWEHILSDDIYLWAEKMGCSKYLETRRDYMMDKFQYDRDNLMAFVDIFGEDILVDIMNQFSVCGKCGESTDNV